MANQLTEHLDTNGLMYNDQRNCIVGRSVISSGIEFVKSIIESLDKGEKVTGVFMDLSKAFLTVYVMQHYLILSLTGSILMKSIIRIDFIG